MEEEKLKAEIFEKVKLIYMERNKNKKFIPCDKYD